jgi:hypothetical protein
MDQVNTLEDASIRSIVRKHTAMVHISNTNLSLVDRKIYNLLLMNASQSGKNTEHYHIELNKLIKGIGHDNLYKNYKFIQESVRKLAGTTVQYNILKKDRKNDWTIIMALFSYAEFKGGILKYSFPEMVRTAISHPNLYTTLNLGYQKALSSKYSMALWEFCNEHIDTGKIPESINILNIKLDKLKYVIGADDKTYAQFKVFNQKVLKPALKEINEHTDLDITFEVKRECRLVKEIIFRMKRKEFVVEEAVQGSLLGPSDNFIKMLNETLSTQDLNYQGIELKLPEPTIKDILDKYPNEKIKIVFDFMLAKGSSLSKIKSRPAYIYSLLNKDIQELQLLETDQKCEMTQDMFRKTNIDVSNKSWGITGTETFKIFCDLAKKEFEPNIIMSWISHLKLASENDNNLCFSVGSGFIKDWLETNYMKSLLKIATQINPKFKSVEIIVQKDDKT